MLPYFLSGTNQLSLRARLCMLILLVIAPAFLVAVYSLNAQRETLEANHRQEVLALSKLGAAHQSFIIETARGLLNIVSHEESIQKGDWDRCNNVLHQFSLSYPWFNNLYVALPNGEVVCRAISRHGKDNLANTQSFQQVLQTNGFVVGEYQQKSITTGDPILPLRGPVFDGSGKLQAVFSAPLDLQAMDKTISEIGLPKNAVMLVLDRNGTVLADSRGGKQGYANKQLPLIKAILEKGAGTIEAAGINSTMRLWGFARAESTHEQTLYVAVGFPLAVIQAETSGMLMRTATGLVAATLLLLVTVWVGTKYLVVDQLNALLNAARRVRSGDFSVRTGLEYSGHEFNQVGKAFDEMAERLETHEAELHRALNRSHQKSIRDYLSGLYNRTYLNEAVSQFSARCQRIPQPVAVIMADIDNFKRINDTFGHAAGDQVIREVAQLLKQDVREGDIPCRYGGEEFLLVLPGATAQSARQKANELLQGARALAISHNGKSLGPIKLSIGVAICPKCCGPGQDKANTVEGLILAADEALYRAKREGRDRVVESYSLVRDVL